MSEPRVLSWFSCGAASAVAARVALEKYGSRVDVVYCDTAVNEHPDNERFLADVQGWLGVEVTRIASEKYASVDDVIERTRYMAGIAGARCTTELKKVPRFAYQRPDDIHVFGLTADEASRADRFRNMNADLELDLVLIDRMLTKADCFQVLTDAGVELPVMYGLGYENNNCLGCVKATSANYWNRIRRDFPDVFARRVEQSAELGVRLVRVRGERVPLSDLPADYLDPDADEDISCGPDCGIQLTLTAALLRAGMEER